MAGIGSLPKKFYKTVEVDRTQDGWAVCLDGKTIKTPDRKTLILPRAELAERVAQEWREQIDVLNIPDMHVTKLSHVALDRTPENRADLVAECVRYAQTDVCVYRVDAPSELAERQAKVLNPLLEWAADSFAIKLDITQDVLPKPQPQTSLDAVKNLSQALDDFTLTGLVYGCGLFGSFTLSWAVLKAKLSADDAFDASRIEEDWQTEQWGIDDEAQVVKARRAEEAKALGEYFAAIT